MILPNIEGNINELKGSLETTNKEDKLMHSVLESDKNNGKLIRNAINHGLFSFNPELIFQQFIENYKEAKDIYGESFFTELVKSESNLRLPETKKRIKEEIEKKFESLQEQNILDKDFNINEKGIDLASLSLLVEELDSLVSKGLLGEKLNKKLLQYGSKENIQVFKKQDNYKDLAIKESIKIAIKRNHHNIHIKDLRSYEKIGKGKISIIYALDASGSMKGNKLDLCKKAFTALAFKAINEKDNVGLLIFNSKISKEIPPTNNFNFLINSIVDIRASNQTNIALTIKKSIELFPRDNSTKHLILITDAMPTFGEEPFKETIEATVLASNCSITISIIGINIENQGIKLAERISKISNGKFYRVKDLENLDSIILQDYYSL